MIIQKATFATNIPHLSIVILALCLSAVCFASEKSFELNKSGVKLLKAGKLEAALSTFESSIKVDPKDMQAQFFKGVTLNRLSRQDEALGPLMAAEKGKYINPDMDFEIGWSLMGIGMYDQAIKRFETYETTNPGRGQTSEFMGRCYLELGQLDQAEKLLNRARNLDPDLKPTIIFYLARLDTLRGDKEAGVKRLMELVNDEQVSPIGIFAKNLMKRLYPRVPRRLARDDKRWRIDGTVGTGLNTNAIGLANHFPTPADISDKRSYFTHLNLHGAYDLLRTQRSTFTLGNSFTWNKFEGGVDGSDLLDNYFYAEYRHRITKLLSASLRISDQSSNVGDNNFRNSFAVNPSLTFRLTDWLVTELQFGRSKYEFFFSSVFSSHDRDGYSSTYNLTSYFRVPKTDLTGRIGYSYTDNNTQGKDFESISQGLFTHLSYKLPLDVTGEIEYVYIKDDYTHLNSFSFPTKKREDNIDIISVQFTKPINKHTSFFIRHNYMRNDSNIPFFDYDQHRGSIGITFHF